VKLRFTPRANADLFDTADYIAAHSPQGARRVRDAILESLDIATRFPRIGRRQSVEGVRKPVTRRYGYIVYYLVDDPAGERVVLTIQHPARDRPMSDT
jgi:plasmid stabilization system protein ParE